MGLGCDLQTLQFNRSSDCFSPLATCEASSGTMRKSPQKGGFFVSSSSIPRSLVSYVYGVFDKMVLPLNSGREPKAIAMTYIVLGHLLDFHYQQLEILIPTSRVFVR